MDKREWLESLDINSLLRKRVRNIMVAAELPWKGSGQYTKVGLNGLPPVCEFCRRRVEVVKIYKHFNQDHLPNAWHVDPFDREGVILTADRLIPASWGGSDSKSNFRTLCTKCSSRRCNKVQIDDVNRAVVEKVIVKNWALFHKMCRDNGLVVPVQCL